MDFELHSAGKVLETLRREIIHAVKYRINWVKRENPLERSSQGDFLFLLQLYLLGLTDRQIYVADNYWVIGESDLTGFFVSGVHQITAFYEELAVLFGITPEPVAF